MGDCYRLDRDTSDCITDGVLRSGDYLAWVPRRERRRIAMKAARAWWYHLLHCAMRPRMTGNNIGIWRRDFERINGYDENYVGWGLEDRDLQLRLGRLGLRFKSILGQTTTFHLWHPPDATFNRNNVGTRNLEYYQRDDIATRCQAGLFQRDRASAHLLSESHVLVSAGADSAETSHRDSDGPVLLPFPARREGARRRKSA